MMFNELNVLDREIKLNLLLFLRSEVTYFEPTGTILVPFALPKHYASVCFLRICVFGNRAL